MSDVAQKVVRLGVVALVLPAALLAGCSSPQPAPPPPQAAAYTPPPAPPPAPPVRG